MDRALTVCWIATGKACAEVSGEKIGRASQRATVYRTIAATAIPPKRNARAMGRAGAAGLASEVTMWALER